MKKLALTIDLLCKKAGIFALRESKYAVPSLYGVTDGKAVGTYLEHKFQRFLHNSFQYEEGSSARGIDFPELMVDMKVTKYTQPQSSCPFKSARQKIYGLGYGLLVFVYDKRDDPETLTGTLDILHTTYIEKHRTADYQTTSGLIKILDNDGNVDDIVAFLMERYLPVDDTEAYNIAEYILQNPPQIGYLTISNALQWRLQYRRAINMAGEIDGVLKVL